MSVEHPAPDLEVQKLSASPWTCPRGDELAFAANSSSAGWRAATLGLSVASPDFTRGVSESRRVLISGWGPFSTTANRALQPQDAGIKVRCLLFEKEP